MDWGAILTSVITNAAPLIGKIADAAMSANSMTPEQLAQLDSELLAAVLKLRKDSFSRAREQLERNAKVTNAIAAKFGKIDE